MIIPKIKTGIKMLSCKKKLNPNAAKSPASIQANPQHNKAIKAETPPAPKRTLPSLLCDFVFISTS